MRAFTIKFDDATIKGHVVMSINPGRERLKLLKEINLKTTNDGSLAFDDNMVESIIKGSELVRKFLISIDLDINGDKITTFDELEYSNAFNTVIMKLMTTMLNGPERLGN